MQSDVVGMKSDPIGVWHFIRFLLQVCRLSNPLWHSIQDLLVCHSKVFCTLHQPTPTPNYRMLAKVGSFTTSNQLQSARSHRTTASHPSVWDASPRLVLQFLFSLLTKNGGVVNLTVAAVSSEMWAMKELERLFMIQLVAFNLSYLP